MMHILGILLSLFLIVAVSHRAQARPASVIINEILADPSDESKGEFAELYNRGDTGFKWVALDRQE
ncbi:uncharacterized protein METZ01_LOCUS445117 [marine metagenome]|uniref:LTD domain-containing protein n=1 Tax=marine metagenome TaxID=408172 RepID=A0A382Z9X0_9ZZZZ